MIVFPKFPFQEVQKYKLSLCCYDNKVCTHKIKP